MNTGLEKSAVIRPFATKKSRLASEKILLADSFATESCRLANRLATKLFGEQRRCGPSVIAQGAWQSWSVQDARDLAPSIALASIHPRGLGAFPEILLWRPSQLSGAEEISYALWLSVCAAHQSSARVLLSSGLSGESAPMHGQRLAFAASIRSKKKKRIIRRRRFEGGRR